MFVTDLCLVLQHKQVFHPAVIICYKLFLGFSVTNAIKWPIAHKRNEDQGGSHSAEMYSNKLKIS